MDSSATQTRKVMLCLFSLSVMQMGALAVASSIADIAASFPDVSTTLVQMLITLPILVQTPVALLSGWFCRRFSAKPLLLAAVSMFLIGGLLPFFSRSFPLIMFSRCLYGFAIGLQIPMVATLTIEFFQGERRAKMMGYCSAIGMMGGMFYTYAGGFLAERGWQYSFLAYLIGVPVFLCLLCLFPGRIKTGSGKAAASADPVKGHLPAELFWIAGISMVYIILYFAYTNNISLFVSSSNLGSASHSGISYSIVNGSGFFGGLLFGTLSQRLKQQMPALYESYEVVGSLKPEAARALGLPASVKVVAGAGDNAAAAVGTGVVGDGGCNISLGTSGTIFISSSRFSVDPNNALHAFAHADGGWHLMGCMLSAASCNKWLCDDILRTTDYAAEQRGITPEKLGRNHVYFLPYLMGERSPINDTNARGTLVGMTMDTSRSDLVQAVLEGVAFAIRDCFEVAKSIGISIPSSKLCGGGSKSPLWRTIFANVLGIPLKLLKTEQGPGYGGAILAMVGCGAYPSVQAAAAELVEVAAVVEPEPELTRRYEARYRQYQAIYPALRPAFPQLL